MKVLITTVPFAEKNLLPIELLDGVEAEYLINPLNKKLSEDELAEMISDFDIIIAGTEPITDFVMERAVKLKMISRVGIGLDSVDLVAAERRGIKVSYTPDAPSPAVAEWTIGLLITLLRSVQLSNIKMHKGQWKRYSGKRIENSIIGIIGLGRIGSRVLNMLSVFGTPKILVNDLSPNPNLDRLFKLEWVDKNTIYRESDIISLHVPLTKLTNNMIAIKQLEMMKSDAMIINTSRGGVVNEVDLYNSMKKGHLAGVAIDSFEQEPYDGPLREIDRCLLTAHMSSMSIDCRIAMEVEATEEVVRFINNVPLKGEVPKEVYIAQREGL